MYKSQSIRDEMQAPKGAFGAQGSDTGIATKARARACKACNNVFSTPWTSKEYCNDSCRRDFDRLRRNIGQRVIDEGRCFECFQPKKKVQVTGLEFCPKCEPFWMERCRICGSERWTCCC